MKQMALALVAAVTVLAGLTAVPAEAAPGPYQGSVPTRTAIVAKRNIPSSGVVILRGRVTQQAGNGRVTGGALRVVCRTIIRGRTVTRVGPGVRYTTGVQRVAGPTLVTRTFWSCRIQYRGGATVFASSISKPVRVRVY